MDRELIKQKIEELLFEYPICEYAYGEPSQIPFSDKIFTICETDCTRYGHSWACPPHAGSIAHNISRVNSYQGYLVFSTVWEVENSWDMEACLKEKIKHEEMTREFRERLLAQLHLPMESIEENGNPPVYILSAGCMICEECSCPDEPCKHPKERLMTMESHGILIMGMLENIGMTYQFGPGTVTYFTMILF